MKTINFEKAYFEFKNSACFTCGYCADSRRPIANVEEWLDVRDSGCIKAFCHATHSPIELQQGKREDCQYRKNADSDGLYCAP